MACGPIYSIAKFMPATQGRGIMNPEWRYSKSFYGGWPI